MRSLKWLVLTSILFLTSFTFSQTNLAVATSNCPCTIFGVAVPHNTNTATDKSVELGVKFISDVDTFVTALRYYKMLGSTGSHTGSLWDVSQNKLATVTFTNETASGWQVQKLANPVHIAAGATYFVSYHAPVGKYANDSKFFSVAFDAPPLHATGGGYAYATSTAYPKNATQTNYYADVMVSNYVTLTWTASPTPNALYNVYRSTTQGGEVLTKPIASDIVGTTYIDPVASGQTYWYEVTATIQSLPSNEINVVIP